MKRIVKLVVGLTLAASVAACGQNFSEGTRIGTVTKLSHKGIIFKSWEGVSHTGQFDNKRLSNGQTTMVSDVMRFSVTDDSVVQKLQKAMSSGEPFELSYREWFIKPPTIDSRYVVTDVKLLGH